LISWRGCSPTGQPVRSDARGTSESVGCCPLSALVTAKSLFGAPLALTAGGLCGAGRHPHFRAIGVPSELPLSPVKAGKPEFEAAPFEVVPFEVLLVEVLLFHAVGAPAPFAPAPFFRASVRIGAGRLDLGIHNHSARPRVQLPPVVLARKRIVELVAAGKRMRFVFSSASNGRRKRADLSDYNLIACLYSLPLSISSSSFCRVPRIPKPASPVQENRSHRREHEHNQQRRATFAASQPAGLAHCANASGVTCKSCPCFT